MKIRSLCSAFCIACLSFASAQGAVLQLSLTPDIALEPSSEHISGLLLNISGDNPQTGLALGIINRSKAASGGVSLALLMNAANNNYSGLQVALLNSGELKGAQLGLLNRTFYDSYGVQLGGINFNLGEGGGGTFFGPTSFSGLQIGILNLEGTMTGAQLGLFNLSKELNGVQLGAFNYATSVNGVQVGVFNRAENLYGIQLGLFNWVDSSPWFTETPDKLATIFPFVNWAF